MVLSGSFAILVQGLLAFFTLLALFSKWRLERVREGNAARKFGVFVLDGMKNLTGAAWLHVTNLTFAELLARFVGDGDECEWYWINIVIDTTLGCAVAYALLHGVNSLIVKILGEDRAEDFVQSGNYVRSNGEFDYTRFMKQTVVWVILVVTSMKAVMVFLMIVFQTPLIHLSKFFLSSVFNDDWLKLVVVMIVTPTIMNTFQFWVTDNIVKWNQRPVLADKEALG